MTSSSFLTEPDRILVADASVLINLNATQCAAAILKAFPSIFVATSHAFGELERGTAHGHMDADAAGALVEAGLLRIVKLGELGSSVFASLVEGSARYTLDDGEAATIAYSVEVGGVALIDERKARSICAARFTDLILGSTVDILIHDAVSSALGDEGRIQAIKHALRDARMRVLRHQLDAVVDLIGADEVASFTSLPQRMRSRS